MKGKVSRWDGLHEKDGDQKFSSKPKPPGPGRRHILKNEWENISHSASGNGMPSNGKWRRSQTSNTKLTAEEQTLRDIIERLKTEVASYTNGVDSASKNDNGESDMAKSLEEISIAVFGRPDPSCYLRQQDCNNFSHTPQKISTLILWEAADTTIRKIKELTTSESTELIMKISNCAAAILKTIHNNIRCSLDGLNKNESFQRPRSMTDLHICECASFLLDLLARDARISGIDATALRDCKASLFTCLARILDLSSILGLHEGNTKNRRSVLFPWGAEKTVNLIVMQSVLPFANSILSDASMTNYNKIRHCCPAIECLSLLLSDPSKEPQTLSPQLSKHAAAILAPLIVDVDLNGQENERPNPLRSSTLKAIVHCWNCSYQLVQEKHSDIELVQIKMSCQCLIAVLDSLHALKKKKRNSNENEAPPMEIDVAALCSRIQNALQNKFLSGNTSMLFQILTSICRTYPGKSASQWHLFLEQSASTSSNGVSLLLKFIEDGITELKKWNFEANSMTALMDALQSTSMLVSAMPLSRWIAGEGKTQTRLGGESYFASRVRKSMIHVIDCTFSLMVAIRDILSSMESIGTKLIDSASLIDAIMLRTSQLATTLCFCGGQNSLLLRPALKLVGCAGEIYVLCCKTIDGTASNFSELIQKATSVFCTVITDTLDIDPIQTASPSQIWLSGSASFEFIDLLLTHESASTERMRMSVICRVARLCPCALAREPFNLASFCKLCSTQCKAGNSESKLSGFNLIESFVIGRKTFSSEFATLGIGNEVADTFCPILLAALEDGDAKVRAVAVASFGYMSVDDWCLMVYSNSSATTSNLDWHYLDAILKHCSTVEESYSKVRIPACKAIGDISTCVLNASFSIPEFVVAFSCRVCLAMQDALGDECTSVKSMVSVSHIL